MWRVNVRELHRRTGAVVDEVARGDVIVIEKRGVPVAELCIAGGDAIHLVSARLAGFQEIWSNDRDLLAAAPYFRLSERYV